VSNDESNDLICDVFGLAFTFVWGLAFALGATDFLEVCSFFTAVFLGVAFGFAFAVVFLVGAFFAILISPFCFIAVCLCKHYM
jgi:hypothetical protein